MPDVRSDINKALDYLARRDRAQALKVVEDLLAGMEPPNRVEIPPGRVTAYDLVEQTRKHLAGEIDTPSADVSLRSARVIA
jgi:hypothetical protein